jgi:hypothetical protein
MSQVTSPSRGRFVTRSGLLRPLPEDRAPAQPGRCPRRRQGPASDPSLWRGGSAVLVAAHRLGDKALGWRRRCQRTHRQDLIFDLLYLISTRDTVLRLSRRSGAAMVTTIDLVPLPCRSVRTPPVTSPAMVRSVATCVPRDPGEFQRHGHIVIENYSDTIQSTAAADCSQAPTAGDSPTNPAVTTSTRWRWRPPPPPDLSKAAYRPLVIQRLIKGEQHHA